MDLTKRVGVLVLSVVLMLAGHAPREASASTPPGTGLVIITKPVAGPLGTPGQVGMPPGATQVKVHLQVAFGKDLAGTAAADPATFKASVTGMGATVLTPLFTDVKDAHGNITGKQADVTLPLKKKYNFKASVFSVIPPGATKPVKGSVKVSFVAVVVVPGPPIISNFSVTNAVGTASGGKPLVNLGQGVIFHADLSDPDGDAVVSYKLDLGDGSTPLTKQSDSGLTALDEAVAYNASGDFTVTLTATDSASQSSTQTLALHVNAPPTAKLKINPTQGTFKYPVTFDALDSGDPDGDALTYAFNFGDGSPVVTGSNTTVTHIYANPGVTKKIYSVSLTVTDSYGVVATAKSSLTVTSGLSGQPMLNITSPLKGEVATVGTVLSVDVALGDASSGAAPDPATFHASFNGAPATSYFTQVKDPKRNNAVVGMHANIPASKVLLNGSTNSVYCAIKSVLFTTTGGTVRTISTSQTVKFTATVGAPPTASFTVTPPEAQVNQTVTFDGSGSKDPAGKPLTYAWDFGDGAKASASSSATATHAYAVEGAYTVTLTVSDGAFSATQTGSVAVRAVVMGGTPALTVSIPSSATNALDFGDLNGNKNIFVKPYYYMPGAEAYPAWVEKCVEITNTGTGTLTINSVSIDNMAAFQVRNAANVQAKTLAAGESDFIDVRFNPRSYTPGSATPPAPAAPGSQAGTLTIVTNAATNGTQTVSLTGNVVSDMPASGVRLMRTDLVKTPDDAGFVTNPITHQPGNASVLDMGVVPTSQSFLFGSVANEGDSTGTITGVDVLNEQGQTSPDFSAQLVHITYNQAPETAVSMASGASLENVIYNPATYQTSGDYIQVTFHPSNTVVAQQRLSARMIVHTDSGDQVVGLTGIGIDAPYYTFGGGDFEFSRTSPGGRTTNLYQSSNVSPATLTVVNIGRKSGTVTAALAGINGGAVAAFSLSPGSLSLGPTQSGTFTLTFAPAAAQHYAGALTVNPGIPYEPILNYLLHGYGKGGVGMLGTSANWYTYDGNDFAQTEMIGLGNTGTQSPFSQIDGLQDPFMVAGNTVDMGQYSNPDWSSLVLLAGKEFTIDGGVFGPYALRNPDGTFTTDLTTSAHNRLLSGQPIYSGGISSHANFVAGIEGNVDIQSDPTTNDTVGHNGQDPIRLDVTPDNVLFYTSVSSNLSSVPTSVIVTSLKWENLSTHTGGVVTPDVVAALGGTVPANDEVLDMRVIKTATGYRAFFVFDDTDASNHQIVADMDLSSAFAVTAHKGLTGTLSALSEANAEGSGNQPIIIDANGLSYTSATVQNPDGSTTMQVFKESLHADAGATLFGSVTVSFGDADAGEVLLDNQGNVFLMTADGLCAFSSTGAFTGYVMESQTYYADNFAGGSANGSDTQDLSDFNAIWLDK